MTNDIRASFRKDLSRSLMVIENVNFSTETGFHVKMLKRNSIGGLLTLTDESLNGKTNFLYDISSKQSFEKVFEVEKMGYTSLSSLINCLKNLRGTLDDYLLDIKYIILRPGFIFTDCYREKYYFCYYPSPDADESTQIADMQFFFNHILSIIDYSDPNVVTLAFNISRIVQSDGFTLQDIPSTVVAPTINEPDPVHASVPAENNCVLSPSANAFDKRRDSSTFFEKMKTYFSENGFADVISDINDGVIFRKIRTLDTADETHEPEKSFQVYDLDLGEAFSLRQETSPEPLPGDTSALNGEMLRIPCLVGTGLQSGTKIVLDHFPFTIGKKKESNDFALDDPTVSRLHCRFYEAEDGYCLEDLNSTNGTFVNNERMESYTRILLSYGDLIKISSQEFYFR